MFRILTQISNILWGTPMTIVLIGTGIYLSIRFGFRYNFRKIKFHFQNTFGKMFQPGQGTGSVSGFAAACTAMANTIGVGNIGGVASAIVSGGPGAIFWMWIAAFFGMATKYAEGVLAVKYRTVDAKGQISGGPMYYIELGLGKKYKPLAIAFAFFGILVAYFGIGTFAQVNSIVDITQLNAGIPVAGTAAILTIAVSIYQIMFTVRRAHDLGRSGWYLLWSIVPLVNIYIAIRISFIEGEKGPNRFGPDPLTTPGAW